jgi:hypothetical protein
MCLSGRGLVVGSYVTFSFGVVGRELCALLCRGLVVGSYVPF